jgi:hypothetical protein
MVPAMNTDRRPLDETPPRAERTVNDVGSGAVVTLLQWTVTATPSTAARAA